jgi:nucleotide-binding universal stress UspA family protein
MDHANTGEDEVTKMETKKRILVAFDGSNASMEAVNYLSTLSCLIKEHIVLFHVFSPLPDYHWDMEGYSDPVIYSQELREAVSCERESKSDIRSRLEAAKDILTDRGFPGSGVTIKIVDRRTGFARDVIGEAHAGYHIIVIGRKGRSNLKPCDIGGVTVKLMQSLDFVPVVLVGEAPSPKKALIALDGSACSNTALSTIGTLLVNSDFDVTLIHVIRGEGPIELMMTASKWANGLFQLAKKPLPFKKMKTKILSGVRSRAEAIIHEANQNQYGTIVVGRKGLSDVEFFCTGMVTHKIAHLAKQQAVWICN